MRPTKGFVAGCGVILILVSVQALLLFNMSTTTPDPAQERSPTAVVSDPPTQDGTELETQKTAFNERVRSFSRVFYSRDYANPAKRHEFLKDFMTPDALASVMRAEKKSPIFAKLAKNKATQAVLFAEVTEGEIDGDMAEATTGVGIKGVLKMIVSETSWVFVKGKWLAYEVDPI